MLAKKFRLSKADFGVLFKRGKRMGNKNFSIIFISNRKSNSVFAVIINKKTAKLAIARNKTRRFIYQIIGENFDKIPTSLNIAIICRKAVNEQNKEELKESFLKLIKK